MNTIEYTIEGSTFSLSYQELRDKYVELVGLSDADFFDRIHEALHLACIVSWFKGRGQWAVSDIGAVHEIAHYLHIPGDTVLADVRAAFNRDCELA